MGLNPLNSLADPICVTYASGTISLMSAVNSRGTIAGATTTTGDFLNDAASATGANGYINNFFNFTAGVGRAGGFNSAWNNGCLSDVGFLPTYTSSLIQFGETGRQP